MKLVFKKWVENLQTMAYNGASMVCGKRTLQMIIYHVQTF